MKWITALNLDAWASTINARTALSELVGELVRASSARTEDFRFPTGDSAQIPGWDGLLEAVGAPPYVPDGKSVWEIGVDEDYFGKANGDYDKRTKKPRAAIPKETTFVFVTPRTWKRNSPTLSEWEAQKRGEGIWRDVKVIDGVGLEDWLDRNAAVAARFARQVLKLLPPTNARSVSEYWDEYSTRFKPPLTEAVLLCDRAEEAKSLIARFSGAAQDILLRADSLDEVVAFAVAAIRKADDGVRKFLEARTLILDTEDAARQLGVRTNLTFIPRGSAISLAAMLAQRGPTLVPLGREAPKRLEATVLTRPSTRELAKAIETMGFTPDRALQLARESSRSVTVLARRIPGAAADRPAWMADHRILIPALLAGGWDSNVAEDQKVLCTLAECADYADIEKLLLPLTRIQDPPIDREGAIWKIRAPVDAFVHLAPLIGRKDLERFQSAAKAVFSEVDPNLDRPDDKPVFQAAETRLRHSRWLRDGLATTLLQVAVLGEDAELNTPGTDPQRFANDLIAALPGLNTDARLIASLQSELTLLMEAAPSPLLLALERLLEGDGAEARRLFREGDFFGPSSPHTAVLWGLEALAWDPEQLSRATTMLAKLARVDPGGKLYNRPINSLAAIFLPWRPATNANLVQRLGSLDNIIRTEPAVAWNLLIQLLPGNKTSVSETAKPRYREAGKSEAEVLTWGIVRETTREIIKRAFVQAGTQVDRWATLIKDFSQFPPEQRKETLGHLQVLVRTIDTAHRVRIWDALRDELARHRSFPQADWAIKEPEISQLENFANSLQPEDILQRFRWLFEEQYPDVPHAAGAGRRDVVEEERENAAKEIIERMGVQGLLQLAADVAYPQFLAIAASAHIAGIDTLDALVAQSLGRGERLNWFALALSGEAERRFGHPWRERVISKIRRDELTPDDAVMLLLGWPDRRETWEEIAALGSAIDEKYWSRKNAWRTSDDLGEVEFAARKYLAVGRPDAALTLIHRFANQLPFELVLDVLDAELRNLASRAETIHNMTVHYVTETFQKLRKRTDVDRLEIAKREYGYLPLLDHADENLTLHELMIEDPGFYVSVICDVFKPASGEPREPTPETQARARAGYQLLGSLKAFPGGQNGGVDEQLLMKWIHEVRRLAAKEDRAQIADQYIGHLLAHAPADPDDQAWPHRKIRDAIETLASDDIETGVRVERHNMRGVYSKALYEGGKQERVLAAEAKAWAKRAAAWPRTFAMLSSYATSWERQADQEDERARQDQMRFE